MSTALPRHVRRALRASVAAATVLALGFQGVAQAAPPVSASAPATPWTSVSDVLAESLQRIAAAAATDVTPASPAPAPAPAPRVFATIDGVELVEPTTSLSAIGFHEGASTAAPLSPVGHAVTNESWMDTPAPTDGPDYRIMSSRGRDAAPTSAVDLAMPEAEEVRAVVTGTVVNVQAYSLYGETPDVLVEIVPDGHTDLKVQMFHVRDARVVVGDRVTAGETVIADHPRLLPFGSQIDRHVGHAGPHVHVQAVRA